VILESPVFISFRLVILKLLCLGVLDTPQQNPVGFCCGTRTPPNLFSP
jgi:hypothetical protein